MNKSNAPKIFFQTKLSLFMNKMLRMLDRVTLKDHITSASLLEKYNLSSVNQLAAEIKLTEAWKATHVASYPVQLETFNPSRVNSGRTVRPGTRKLWNDEAKYFSCKNQFSAGTQLSCGIIVLWKSKMQPRLVLPKVQSKNSQEHFFI